MVFSTFCPLSCVYTCFVLYLLLGFAICEEEKEWDYLIFAQRWPPSICLDMGPAKCKIPDDVNEWVIHGLWPTSVHGYPSFCNKTWKFHTKDVESILPELNIKWPNLITGSTAVSFWSHEWQKHGTCAASLDKLHGVLEYFVNSLKLQEIYNIYDLLKDSDILPDAGRPYVLEYVENSLEIMIGKKAKVFCVAHKGYDYPLLDTVYICMDKNFDLINCDISPEPACNKTYVSYFPIRSHQPVCPRFTEL